MIFASTAASVVCVEKSFAAIVAREVFPVSCFADVAAPVDMLVDPLAMMTFGV